MTDSIQVGDIVRHKDVDRSFFMVLKLAPRVWNSSPFVMVREYDPGILFTDKVVVHEFMPGSLIKDVFQTLLMQAQLRNWFSKQEAECQKTQSGT